MATEPKLTPPQWRLLEEANGRNQAVYRSFSNPTAHVLHRNLLLDYRCYRTFVITDYGRDVLARHKEATSHD